MSRARNLSASDSHSLVKLRVSCTVHRDRGAPQLADVFIAMEKFSIESCVRGYHIYSDIREASVGEQLPCEREKIHVTCQSSTRMNTNKA